MKILLLDIAWLAGILEGEGCFQMRRSGGYLGSVCIALQMTDLDTVQKAAALFGSKVYGPHGPYGVSTQATYQTFCFGSTAASWMMTLYSFMGYRRKAKIKELLAVWKDQRIMDGTRKASCHPNQKRFAKDKCRVCYMKHYNQKRAQRTNTEL
jgi:hypothetical protein